MHKWLCIKGDVYRQIRFGNYPAELLCYSSRIYFVTEAARLGEARTEARTYQQLTCSCQTGTPVALLKATLLADNNVG